MRRLEKAGIILATLLIFGVSGYAVFQSNEAEGSFNKVLFFMSVIIAAFAILPVLLESGSEDE